jgi:hypothetical protein
MPDPRPDNIGRLAAALRALNAEVMLAEDFDPSELGLAPDEGGLSLGGNWVLRTRLGRLDIMQDVAGAKSYDGLRSAAVERDVPETGSAAHHTAERFAALASARRDALSGPHGRG